MLKRDPAPMHTDTHEVVSERAMGSANRGVCAFKRRNLFKVRRSYECLTQGSSFLATLGFRYGIPLGFKRRGHPGNGYKPGNVGAKASRQPALLTH